MEKDPMRRERFQRAAAQHRADVPSLTQPRRADRAGDLPRPKPRPQETELHHRPVSTLSRLVCEMDLSREKRRARESCYIDGRIAFAARVACVICCGGLKTGLAETLKFQPPARQYCVPRIKSHNR